MYTENQNRPWNRVSFSTPGKKKAREEEVLCTLACSKEEGRKSRTGKRVSLTSLPGIAAVYNQNPVHPSSKFAYSIGFFLLL